MYNEIRIIKSKTNYTEEQQEIINLNYDMGCIVKVNAFAGTGKSTTLKGFAKKRQFDNMLYLAFNKSIQLEAQKSFPKNVLSKTSHSLAFRNFGQKLKHKLSFGELKPLFLSKYFDIHSNFKAMLAWETVKNFMQSADFEMSYDNIPKEFEEIIIKKNINKEEIFVYSENIWEAMIDVENEDIQATHDTYLKLYQLSKPKLHFDFILIDEAQDTTPCVFDIINRQKCTKVFVGDAHQAIYGFRGAINAMDLINPDYNFYLTKSFRFLPEIAEMANNLLFNLKKEKVKIIGNENVEKKENSILANLGRTNSGIFGSAIETPGKLFFVGGLNSYKFTGIFDAYNLWINEIDKINNPFVKLFNNFQEYEEYGEEILDPEIISNVKLIKKYGRRIPGLLYDLKNREVDDELEADAIFTTSHKSKGMEWDNIDILDDFIQIIDQEIGNINKDLLKKPEEINLFYVTITRAKSQVYLNQQLNEFFHLNNKFNEIIEKNINQIRRDYP